MADVKARIKLPKTARKGELVEIKTLVTHPMESGQRKDAAGATIPRKIINKFTCSFNGKQVCDMALYPSISANPYVSFFVKVEESGNFEFTWVDDDGSVYDAQQRIEVAG